MPDSFFRRIKQVGALGLGAIFYFLILAIDAIAAVVNAVKKRFELPQLTDFRRDEEQLLHIPVQRLPFEKYIPPLKSILPSEDTLTFTISHLDDNPDEVLLEVSIQQHVEINTEIELSLSDTEYTHIESIFLFMHPFNHLPGLHYPADQLWFKIPTNRTLLLSCIDVQPDKEHIRLSALSLKVLDWR